ncbi:MAG: very short patch repair endonuclease [Acetatifactor sp.]|nr:very short patch repair endonuclease [Acetatifactor sp.]
MGNREKRRPGLPKKGRAENARHYNMQRIKSKDTSIELKLRKALWAKGYRYRKNVRTLPGVPDIVLTKYKIAIFCDSEFFHGKDWEVLKPQLERGNNAEFWIQKITNTKRRDDEANKKLLYLGWTVIRFWGKDILKHADECVKVVEETIFDMETGEAADGLETDEFEEETDALETDDLE